MPTRACDGLPHGQSKKLAHVTLLLLSLQSDAKIKAGTCHDKNRDRNMCQLLALQSNAKGWHMLRRKPRPLPLSRLAYISLCCAVLCYALICHAMICYAMLCYVVLCLCSAMPDYARLCHAMPCHAMPCHAMLPYAILCCATIYYAMLLYAVLCCART